MNTITNDMGRVVPAVGAPGSVARMRCQYPGALARFAAAYADTDDVVLAFDACGVSMGELGGPMGHRAFIIASGIWD